MTWDEAFAYVQRVLPDECAAQGLTVEITDPRLIAVTNQLIRAGRDRLAQRALEDGLLPSRRESQSTMD